MISKIDEILSSIDIKKFQIPNNQIEDLHFTDYFAKLLRSYCLLFKKEYSNELNKIIKEGEFDNIIESIESLSEGLIKLINSYYSGEHFSCYEKFRILMEKFLVKNEFFKECIVEGSVFYRARMKSNKQFLPKDLFHVDLANRHIVTTNRYSVHGFPALYLGESCYVCWEEFDRPNLRDIWFSKLILQSNVEIIKIQRIEDFFSDIITSKIKETEKQSLLKNYITIFPLVLACTIKVKNTNAYFKPEYIIPQFLSNFVSKSTNIFGIKFPSTKVNYSKLNKIGAYNYVFPIKELNKTGYCPILSSTFSISQPTSIEFEEIIQPNKDPNLFMTSKSCGLLGTIELLDDHPTSYAGSSFGKIEWTLFHRKTYNIY